MRRRGFTLVELIIVILILAILMGLVIYAVGAITARAKHNKTTSLIQTLENAMQAYYSDFRAYPPDGYDFDVVVDGVKLKGTASLVYHLGWLLPDPPGSGNYRKVELKRKVDMGDGRITITTAHGGKPYWPDLKTDDLTPWGEIKDGWANPMHYDNLEEDEAGRVQFTPQTGGGWHMSPTKYHKDPDPRVAKNRREGFNPGTYDIWSHGPDGHTKDPKVDDDIWRGKAD